MRIEEEGACFYPWHRMLLILTLLLYIAHNLFTPSISTVTFSLVMMCSSVKSINSYGCS